MNDRDAVIITFTGSIAIVRLNRPTHRNSLSLHVLKLIEQALNEIAARNEIAAIIFTGTDDVFTAGADLRELSALDPATAHEFSGLGQRLFQSIADARQLTIAAINGYCFGGGLDFALACDVRIASPSASFSHPGARRGIITGWGGTQRLPRIIGRTKALELFISADRYSSVEALEMGLISAIGDPVVERAIEFALGATATPTVSRGIEQYPSDNPPLTAR